MTGSELVDVAAVRARHRIEDVIADAGVELRPSGRGYLGCCPFHDDSTASLSVGGVPDRFHCFGCGATGDVIDFIGRLHRVGFRDAVALLDDTAATRVRLARPRPVTPAPPTSDVAAERAFEINALAWEHYTRPVAHQTARQLPGAAAAASTSPSPKPSSGARWSGTRAAAGPASSTTCASTASPTPRCSLSTSPTPPGEALSSTPSEPASSSPSPTPTAGSPGSSAATPAAPSPHRSTATPPVPRLRQVHRPLPAHPSHP